MANFKDKMKNKTTIGQRLLNADEALGLSFKNSAKTLSTVKISALSDNPYQPRKSMDENYLKELSQSIEETGLLQPIIITSINNNPNRFYIVAGHRRVAACKLLGLNEIDAVIYIIDDIELRTYSIIENIQRENLSLVDEAFAIKALVDSGVKQVDICKKLGKNKSAISKLIKITELNPDFINDLNSSDRQLGLSTLYELTSIDFSKQQAVLQYIQNKKLGRDDIRNYIKSLDETSKKVSPAKLFKGFVFSKKIIKSYSNWI